MHTKAAGTFRNTQALFKNLAPRYFCMLEIAHLKT